MLRNLLKSTLIKKYSQNTFYDVKEIHTISQHLVGVKTDTLEKKPEKGIKETLSQYTTEQEGKILKHINTLGLNELLGYEISKGRAKKLLTWRMRNSLIKDLSDILAIEGFDLKVADKFFKSLLLEPKRNQANLDKGQARATSFITPPIEAQQRQEIKSCVSVHIGVNNITWSRLDVPDKNVDAPCLLTHWQHHEISVKTLHLNELIQRCLYIHHLIPTADCYIFESPQIAQAASNPGSVEQQNINIQKAQAIAIMGYALASRNSQLGNGIHNDIIVPWDKNSPFSRNIFYVRRFLTARLFNHLVGTERVSSEETVLNMMRTFYNKMEVKDVSMSQQDPPMEHVPQLHGKDKNFSGHIHFPAKLRKEFSLAPRYCREFLSQTLLLNLAFIRLILLQDSASIATLSRGNKPKLSDDEFV